MQLETSLPILNERVDNYEPRQVLSFVSQRAVFGRITLVSSFGTESIVLLHMISCIDRNLPILFIDTLMLFKETLAYQTDVARQLGLSDVRRIRPNLLEVSDNDQFGDLNLHDKDACCSMRKTRPLQHALNGFDTWITGRKRFQSGTRSKLEVFEDDENGRVKVNPLAHWQPKDLRDYIERHNLPRHPLLTKGFASIGCEPCTSPVKVGEDARAGRWRDSDKTECGIHFTGGKTSRQPMREELPS